MVAYLLRSEDDAKVERDIRRYKDFVFAVNTELFFELWPEESNQGLSIEDEDEIEWLVPENEDDVKAMIAELQKAGWNG